MKKRIIWCVTCRIFYTRRIFYGSRNFYHQKVHNLSYILHTYDFFIALIDQKLSSFEIQNSFDSLVFFGFIICLILWIRVKIDYTQLSLTFFYYYRPILPIYHTSKKIIFMKKSHIFGSKMCSRRSKTCSIRKPR